MSIDEDAWSCVLNGWIELVLIADEGKIKVKDVEKWITMEKKQVQSNSMALYAIFNGVDEEQFKLISTCESAKEAWDVL